MTVWSRSVARPRRRLPLALAIGATALVAGCALDPSDLPYYWQSALGQIEVLHKARPIDELLASGTPDVHLRPRLERALQIRAFAVRELDLPANGSYTRYADLGRAYVVWNVFATPQLSMTLKQWCFPVAGCVSYRGYFDHGAAERYAARLRAEGWEVHVAGVPAYSTLGWFDDPVLNTFAGLPAGALARLIFHELAHQRVYLKGDSTFNESFATTVEQIGVERWLQALNDPAIEASYRVYERRRRAFVDLLVRHRHTLESIYAQGGDETTLRAGKAAVFESLRTGYQELKQSWDGYSGYDRWFGGGPSNAQLASVATYHDLVPAFQALLARQHGDLPAFYAAVAALASQQAETRNARLQALVPTKDAAGPKVHSPALLAHPSQSTSR